MSGGFNSDAGRGREPSSGRSQPESPAAADASRADDAEAENDWMEQQGEDAPPFHGGQSHMAESGAMQDREVEVEVDPIQAMLDELTQERDGYLDSLQRLQADFDNYRKRLVKQQAEQADRAAEGLIKSLLPVLDTMDLALVHAGGSDLVSSSKEGSEEVQVGALSQVSAALLDVLGKQGLERLAAQGMMFDPNEHEAVMHEEGGGDGPAEVVEVLRSGWRWKGRVLRPAMVKVKG